MKPVKKIIAFLVVGVLSLFMTFPAVAETEKIQVVLRIEGAEETLFYNTVEVPYSQGLTALDVVEYVDSNCNELDVTIVDGYYGEYISGINGENEAQILYDGWLYTVNGISATVGISGYEVKDGDSIVLYYSDSYGAEPFQTPMLDASKIDKGILKFTSNDVSYDENYNPIEKTNPVVGATVTWGYDGKVAKYITNENGEVKIDANQLSIGAHSVQIEKYSTTTVTFGGKLPLVLRLPADTTVIIEEEKQSTSGNGNDSQDSPKTGENDLTTIVTALLFVSFIAVVSGKKIFIKL